MNKNKIEKAFTSLARCAILRVPFEFLNKGMTMKTVRITERAEGFWEVVVNDVFLLCKRESKYITDSLQDALQYVSKLDLK